MKKHKIQHKIKIPGISATDILEYQELFPELLLNLSKIAYLTVVLAQMRIYADKEITAKSLVKYESVNKYIKTLINSDFSTYIQAIVAIKRTVAVYAINGSDEKEIIEDHYDLHINRKGKSSLKDSNSAMFKGPKELRAYRRGIMHSIAGSLQAIPIHRPLTICADVTNIEPDNFLNYLPFDSKIITIDAITNDLKIILNGEAFIELSTPIGNKVKDHLLPLEIPLGVTRNKVNLPETEPITEKTPFWKKQATNQLKRIKSNETE